MNVTDVRNLTRNLAPPELGPALQSPTISLIPDKVETFLPVCEHETVFLSKSLNYNAEHKTTGLSFSPCWLLDQKSR